MRTLLTKKKKKELTRNTGKCFFHCSPKKRIRNPHLSLVFNLRFLRFSHYLLFHSNGKPRKSLHLKPKINFIVDLYGCYNHNKINTI